MKTWPAPGYLPATRVLRGSAVVKVCWGITRKHSQRRARRWIEETR